MPDSLAEHARGRRVLLLASARFVEPAGGAGELRLEPADDARHLDLAGVRCVTLVFPKPAEGRPYTQARVLRERGFTGTLRAVGAVVVDALGFLRRCGVDEVVLRDERDEAHAADVLARFTVLGRARAPYVRGAP